MDNIFPPSDIGYILALPEVGEARTRLDDQSGSVCFTIGITPSVREALEGRLGISLEGVDQVPMRWIRGDMMSHVDVSARGAFERTYLVYISGNGGDFVVGKERYPIDDNTAFVFDEGLSHRTEGTGTIPRLLFGPMSEAAQHVGSPPLTYYASEDDALNFATPLGYSGTYTVDGAIYGYDYWRIAGNSTGTSSQAIVYANGSSLDVGGSYNLYPASPCFLEGTRILCLVDGTEVYIPIQDLDNDSLVKTSLDGFKRVELLGRSIVKNPGNDLRLECRLYRCPRERYPELDEDLYLTGCHSILVDSLTDIQKKQTEQYLGRLYVTDRKYRLMAVVDERAEPWRSAGVHTVWHVALQDENDGRNFGIFVNGGLLVETCSIRFLRQKSNMELVRGNKD